MDVNGRLNEIYEKIGQDAQEVFKYDSSAYGAKVFADEYGFDYEQVDEIIKNYKEMKSAEQKRYTEEGIKAFEENTDPKYTILRNIRYTKNKYIDGVKTQAVTKLLKEVRPEEIDDNFIEQLDKTDCDIKQILNNILTNDKSLFGREDLKGNIERIQTMYNQFENDRLKSEEEVEKQQNSPKTEKTNFFKRLAEKVKKLFKKNDTKMLPEGKTSPTNDAKREEYLKSLQIGPSDLTPQAQKGNIDERLSENHIRQNDGPEL
ncbi:MAG: hypothetical protein IKE01_03670 [Clostridia bacterium]|nr:hypothetical protein [Clostridia bacterium]